jgi:hypothetical protein
MTDKRRVQLAVRKVPLSIRLILGAGNNGRLEGIGGEHDTGDQQVWLSPRPMFSHVADHGYLQDEHQCKYQCILLIV